ncbi:MAG: hypothetical protein Q4D42_00055 [Eubacteriales bacterium]|nr:hypothetical protein [Eubacteriales bacterium]
MNPMIIPACLAVILLQALLSQRENQYWGLILPIVVFAATVVLCVWFFLFGRVSWQCTIETADGQIYTFTEQAEADAFKQTLEEDEIVAETVVQPAKDANTMTYAIYALRLFFCINIITVILLLIYWRERKRM